ncbi:MAG: lipoyl synthase [Candidatus Gygaella obscura]|nr:lipoyl synthase [Candidatus Gygaella obscura]
MSTTIVKKPSWMKKKIILKDCVKLNQLFSRLKLHTVCHEAMCPNISECFNKGVATFLIMGDTCTRRCGFCNVKKGNPKDLDDNEPDRVLEAVKELKLNHVVVTSVTRDDLEDKGASHFVKTIKTIKDFDNVIKVEVLVPDFLGRKDLIEIVLNEKPDIFAHNVEMVSRLYTEVRPDSDYRRCLEVLRIAKDINKDIYTKSGIMLGLGETHQEVMEVLGDLRKVNCDFLSIGQYLSPSKSHYPVKEFVKESVFNELKIKALEMGFLHVESAPYVRSSYIACEYLKNK